jgi:hypothetical protein
LWGSLPKTLPEFKSFIHRPFFDSPASSDRTSNPPLSPLRETSSMTDPQTNAAFLEVGYGKSPRHTQFKMGPSGNLHGRRRVGRSLGVNELALPEAYRVILKQDRHVGPMSAVQTILRSQLERATDGNIGPQRAVLKMIKDVGIGVAFAAWCAAQHVPARGKDAGADDETADNDDDAGKDDADDDDENGEDDEDDDEDDDDEDDDDEEDDEDDDDDDEDEAKAARQAEDTSRDVVRL